jgi:hypothetical protein
MTDYISEWSDFFGASRTHPQTWGWHKRLWRKPIGRGRGRGKQGWMMKVNWI